MYVCTHTMLLLNGVACLPDTTTCNKPNNFFLESNKLIHYFRELDLRIDTMHDEN